jgi:hypothetical protein
MFFPKREGSAYVLGFRRGRRCQMGFVDFEDSLVSPLIRPYPQGGYTFPLLESFLVFTISNKTKEVYTVISTFFKLPNCNLLFCCIINLLVRANSDRPHYCSVNKMHLSLGESC